VRTVKAVAAGVKAEVIGDYCGREQMGEPALVIAKSSGRENSYGIGQLLGSANRMMWRDAIPVVGVKKQLSSATGHGMP
jgi:hypothetical protein